MGERRSDTAERGVTAAKPSFGQWLQRESYLGRVDWHLDGTVPRHERKRILRSLRDDIAADAVGRDLREVLRGLGDPGALAAGYAEGAARRPRWTIGIIAGGAALLTYWIVSLAYALGMLAVVQQFDLGRARSDVLFVEVSAFSDASGVGVGWGGGIAWILVPLLFAAIVFLLAGRAWRGFQRRR